MNKSNKRAIHLLLVEDSLADITLMLELLAEVKAVADVRVVTNGEDAMKYLLQKHPYDSAPQPDMIVLDLNLPKKDGREVLEEVKNHPSLKHIPIIILTTSQSDDDILNSYEHYASCYITKPMDLEKYVDLINSLNSFWFSLVTFPTARMP